jgi:uncharacterized DUF497 family protein
MRITCDPAKRQRTLQERGLDMRRAKEIFAGYHFVGSQILGTPTGPFFSE